MSYKLAFTIDLMWLGSLFMLSFLFNSEHVKKQCFILALGLFKFVKLGRLKTLHLKSLCPAPK